jgi:hypothetical protein
MTYSLNRVNLTEAEETCILRFLRQAADCGYPSANEQWYPVINSIMRKYYATEIQEAQLFYHHYEHAIIKVQQWQR